MKPARRSRFAVSRLVAGGVLVLAVSGCATWKQPDGADDAPVRARAITTSNQGVRLSAAVLSAQDSRQLYGDDIGKARAQPVWFEVHNQTDKPLWLLRSGTDPDYFSPLEIAWSMHTTFGGDTNAKIDAYFDQRGFRNPIPPGETRSGVLFTNPDRGSKLVNVDLVGNRLMIPFSLFLPVPDDAANPRFAQSLFAYPASAVTDYNDLAALRDALERLPCCATDAAGTGQGDPLNLVVVGDLRDVGAALVRRNFRREPREADFTQHVFGRQPDAVLRKQAQAGAPATWIRAWLTPLRFEGQPVYIAQVGRPIGGRFAPRNDAVATLQADVDEARNLFIQDMMYSGGLDKLGYVNGVGAITRARSITQSTGQAAESSRRTFANAIYHTDGLRAVLFFATRPLSLSDVHLLDWVPYLERREAAAP